MKVGKAFWSKYYGTVDFNHISCYYCNLDHFGKTLNDQKYIRNSVMMFYSSHSINLWKKYPKIVKGNKIEEQDRVNKYLKDFLSCFKNSLKFWLILDTEWDHVEISIYQHIAYGLQGEVKVTLFKDTSNSNNQLSLNLLSVIAINPHNLFFVALITENITINRKIFKPNF